MKFFIDTARLDEIQAAAAFGILDGVTTNPSLMAKAGVQDVDAHYRAICELVPGGDISAEVISTDYESMVAEARRLAALHPQIVVKIPMIPAGVRALSTLSRAGIPTNCTLIFSPMQALLAAKAGAKYVSPFVGRLDDIAHDGMELIAQIREIFDNYDFDTQILAASLRHSKHVLEAARLGADVATFPYSVLVQLFKHPLTDIGLQQFLADYTKVQQA